jgi:hypothetical protein
MNSGRGTAALHITEIQALDLKVVADSDRHGNIVGVPVYIDNPQDESYLRAMELSDALLELAKGNVRIDPWKPE